MILMGRPFSTSKFIVSRALSAEKGRKISNKKTEEDGIRSRGQRGTGWLIRIRNTELAKNSILFNPQLVNKLSEI
jgi:hypothetical protein